MEDQIQEHIEDEMGPGAYIEIYRECNVELGRLSKSTSCFGYPQKDCACVDNKSQRADDSYQDKGPE